MDSASRNGTDQANVAGTVGQQASDKFLQLNPAQDGSIVWREFSGDWRRPDSEKSYQLYWRDSDGFGQILPRPAPDEIASFYDLNAYYTHTNSYTDDRRAGKWARKVVRHLAWRADKGVQADTEYWHALFADRTRRVLEIGCGHAEKLEWLSEKGHQVLGVEPDAKARAAAADRGVPVLEGTAEELPQAIANGQPFDAILIFHALEHCLDPVLAVENAASLLTSGGQLIIEVPNNACLGRAFYGTVWYWLDVPRHLNFFTRASLRGLTESAGLTFDRIEYHGYCRQFDDAWLASQSQIATFLGAAARDSIWDQMRYLAKSARAAEDRKYDSIRMFFSKP